MQDRNEVKGLEVYVVSFEIGRILPTTGDGNGWSKNTNILKGLKSK